MTSLHSGNGLAVKRRIVEIGDFQNYVFDAYRKRLPEWPEAKRLIQLAAEALLREVEEFKAPISPAAIAPLLRIKWQIAARTDSRLDGSLTPEGSYFRAVVFVDDQRFSGLSRRARFTFAHECGHTLFFDLDSRTLNRIIPVGLPSNRGSDLESIDRREEGLCYDFARALLLPTELLRDLDTERSLGHLFRSCKSFDVSEEVIIRRLMYDLDRMENSIVVKIETPLTAGAIRVFNGRLAAHNQRQTAAVRRGVEAFRSIDDVGRLAEQVASDLGLTADAPYLAGATAWLRWRFRRSAGRQQKGAST